jgi:hypothetical protein
VAERLRWEITRAGSPSVEEGAGGRREHKQGVGVAIALGVTKGRAASEATALYSVDRARRSTRPPTLNVSATSRIIITKAEQILISASAGFMVRCAIGLMCQF